MRRAHIAILVSLLVASPLLTACESFDPDSLDVFGWNEKKRIPGDRKALFPEGVPGVSQGVPPELIKGNKPPEVAAEPSPEEKAAAEKAAKEAALAAKPKRKRAPVAAKPLPGGSTPTQVTVQPQQQSQPQQQQPQQQQAQPGAPAPWPATPATGTFQR